MINPAHMKIAIINDMLWGGGRERRIVQLIKGLKKSGCGDIHLILLDERVDYPEVFDLGIRVTIIRRRMRKDPTVFVKLASILRSDRPDVVNAWSYLSSVYAGIVCAWLRVPFVSSFVADCNPPRWISAENVARLATFRLARRIVSNTRLAHDRYRTPIAKRVVIHNGFDATRKLGLRNREEVLSEFGLSPDSVVLTMVARFSKEKDFGTFLDACRQVQRSMPGISVFCIGQGSLAAPVVAGLSELDRSYVRFPGFRSDVEAFVAASDIGVLCTDTRHHQEGISNSLLEFMAFGKPVVATNGGGTNELVEDGENGYLVEPFDVGGLAERLERLVGDGAHRRVMGARAAVTVAERFSLDRMTAEFIELYGATSGRA